MNHKTTNAKMYDAAKRDAWTGSSTKTTQVVDRALHTMREITTTVAGAADKTARKAIERAEETATRQRL